MDRRKFLEGSSLALGAALFPPLSFEDRHHSSGEWAEFRALFSLDPKWIHLTQMLMASHPKPVQDAIDLHRKMLNENPTEYVESGLFTLELRARNAAAMYVQAHPDEILLTDSTTMGLGLMYTGWKLKAGEEVLTTTHDHYSTEKSLEYAALKNGASVRRISLYDNPALADTNQIIERLSKAIRPSTRVVAVTWVHSSTGVKLPIRLIADVIQKANEKRTIAQRIYLGVDGVHGFGVEDVTMADLGCDCFCAGTHKWIFGPRGTGLLWVRKDAWSKINPTIPAFSEASYGMWMGEIPPGTLSFSDLHSPGGFHSFEHRWALNEAFGLLMKTGKAKIQERTRQLNTKFKNALKSMSHITLHTPLDEQLSSGINCFEVKGMKPNDVLTRLHTKHKIISSITPYKTAYNRITPCVINTDEELDLCIRALETINDG